MHVVQDFTGSDQSALDWFVKSTLMVDQAAQLLAGTVYLLAITVQPEADKARVWAEVACDNDDPVR